MNIANSTFQLDFLQQMQSNSLPVERYIKFTMQNIYYLQEFTNMLKKVSKKVREQDMKKFMDKECKSNAELIKNHLLNLNVKNAPSITPSPAIKKVLQNFKELMKADPVFFAVALLASSGLWDWLAFNLNIAASNVFYSLKNKNMAVSSSEEVTTLLNKYLNTAEKKQKAHEIFNRQLLSDYEFYKSS